MMKPKQGVDWHKRIGSSLSVSKQERWSVALNDDVCFVEEPSHTLQESCVDAGNDV